MRPIIFLIIYLSISVHSALAASVTPKDSLLKSFTSALPPSEKIRIYRDLADLCFETPDEMIYLKKLCQEAQRSKDTKQWAEALGNLSFAYIKVNQIDSARYYMDLIQRSVPRSDTEHWLTFLEMRLFDEQISQSNSDQTIEGELKNLTAKEKKESGIYPKISNAYAVGISLLTYEKNKEAIPYLQTAVDLSLQLPLEKGYRLQTMTLRTLANACSVNGELNKSISLIERVIGIDEAYYDQFCRKNRPFYNLNVYLIQNYTSLMINVAEIPPKKAQYYLRQIVALCGSSTHVLDKYSCFLSINNYYLHLKDYKKAIAANDSLIKYANGVAPYNIPLFYEINSQCYERLGKYEEAFESLKRAHVLEDSLSLRQGHEQLNELQVKYDVDKLTYEKTQLEIRNKRIIVICLSIVLCITVVVCIYLYLNLKKEKRMKNRLNVLKNKAEESENMKTAFINSVCHEIRTPLNAIVGFTDLMFVEDIDEEMKRSFPEEIQKNTVLLTSLIQSMLEVSQLDVSDEKLPCEPADIGRICHQEMDRLRGSAKPGIQYHLDLPEESVLISTNERYLTLVLENLLNNANKFTETGHITLRYAIDKEKKQIQISVTDTGCGIPVKKQEVVFERFIKLDTFKPGNGLGLYLCRLITKRLSGDICMDAGYTSGTRVLISLPV